MRARILLSVLKAYSILHTPYSILHTPYSILHTSFLLITVLLQESPEYDAAIQPCHQRSAERLVAGATRNGGLYIKLGQGLGSFNQALPRQYIDTLKVLQDMVRTSAEGDMGSGTVSFPCKLCGY